jgi:Rod binding domain-containing protein
MEIGAITSPASTAAALPGLLGQATLRRDAPPAEQAKAAASQFEAIMLRQLLQQSVGSMMGSGKDAAGGIYGYLLTDVFANSIAAGGGLGLSKVIEQQLAPRATTAATTES